MTIKHEADLLGLGRRERKPDEPYLRIEAPGDWEYRVLAARRATEPVVWYMAVSSPATWGTLELGDGYVFQLKQHPGVRLVEVDGAAPTPEQLEAFHALLAQVKPDPMTAMGL